jgi:hypothetical protein
LFPTELLSELALGELAIEAVGDDRVGHGTRQGGPLPLGSKLGIVRYLIGQYLVERAGRTDPHRIILPSRSVGVHLSDGIRHLLETAYGPRGQTRYGG